jgi:hypothetical protein
VSESFGSRPDFPLFLVFSTANASPGIGDEAAGEGYPPLLHRDGSDRFLKKCNIHNRRLLRPRYA